MSEKLKPIRLKMVFIDGPPRLGKNSVSIVDSETNRPIVGLISEDTGFTINKMGKMAKLTLNDFDWEIKKDE